MKHHPRLKRFLILLVILFVVHMGLLLYLLVKTHTLSNDLKTATTTQKEVNAEQEQLIYSETDAAKQLLAPAVMAKEKRIAFPELGISLPYNPLTRTLRYSFNAGETDVRVVSSLVNYHGNDALGGCSELVRISTSDDTKEPFNPWEEKAGTVHLSNGQSFTIIAAKAYENHEASTMRCPEEAWYDITPQDVVGEFKKAEAL